MACKKIFAAAVFCAALWATDGRASIILGEMWAVPDIQSRNAEPSNFPQTAPDITFTLNNPNNQIALNFGAPGNFLQTRKQWLESGGATNIVGSAALLNAVMSTIGINGVGTMVEFSGTVNVASGQIFGFRHDDGMTLTVDGQRVITSPGPSSLGDLSIGSYLGPVGLQNFTLTYAACCNVNSYLTSVPEPLSLALFGAALVGLGAARRLRRSQCL